MDQNQMGPKCSCAHHKTVPVFVVLIGLAFLLEALEVLTSSTVSIIWPVLLIALGLGKMFGGGCSCCSRD